MLGSLTAVLASLAAALAVAIATELGVAWLSRLRPKGLCMVAAVNVITNPTLNLVLLLIVPVLRRQPACVGEAMLWTAVGLLEIGVVVVEWRLLAWGLGATAARSGHVLRLSFVMNAASFVAGVLILGAPHLSA